MVRALDFYVRRAENMAPSKHKHIPTMELEMGSQIDDRTRIPLSWMLGMIAALITAVATIVGGAILYLADMKTTQAVDSIRITNLDSRVNSLESSYKEITEMKGDLKTLAAFVNELRDERKKDGARGHK